MIKQIKSFKYAFEGVIYTIRSEAHMRFHIVAAVSAVILGVLFRISRTEWAVLCTVIALVTALELVNTAIERVCDFCSEKYQPLIKIAKDAGAGAVLIAAAGSGGAGCFIFIKPDKIAELAGFFTANPVYIVFALMYIALCVLFVVKFRSKSDLHNNKPLKK